MLRLGFNAVEANLVNVDANAVQKYGTDFYHVGFLLFPTLLSSLTDTPQVVKNDYFEHGPDENK